MYFQRQDRESGKWRRHADPSLVQITLTAWAVYYRNTIQVVGLTIFNLLLLIYAAIQVGEINEVLGTDTDNREGTARIFSLPIKILCGLVIAVIATAQIAFFILAWFIWREFGWRIYRFLGADLAIRRYYRQYQIFECILCFSFFFFLGFSVQVGLLSFLFFSSRLPLPPLPCRSPSSPLSRG